MTRVAGTPIFGVDYSLIYAMQAHDAHMARFKRRYATATPGTVLKARCSAGVISWKKPHGLLGRLLRWPLREEWVG